MSTCAEHQLLSSMKSFKDIDIPPRKLLTRRAAQETVADMYSESPRFSSSDETLLQKFLTYSKLLDSDDDDADPYSSDHFRMYEFKVRLCTRSRSHDWTDCPFAHRGEKASRRDPRRFHYSGNICPEYRRGGCSRGDSCEFAHGVFECWLHPARYRTEACKDGKNCKRKVCFFAHTPRQLRILPVNSNSENSLAEISCKKNKFLNPASISNNCCLFCHCAATSSPNSTLLSMSHFSPPLSPSSSGSPPLSPVKQRRTASGFSPISRHSDRFVGTSEISSGLNHVVTELMSSLEGLNFGENSPLSAERTQNLRWLDVSFNGEDQQQQFILSPSNSLSYEDQQQFIFSPFTQTTPTSTNYFSNEINNVQSENGSSSCQAPDLAWVNELLM